MLSIAHSRALARAPPTSRVRRHLAASISSLSREHRVCDAAAPSVTSLATPSMGHRLHPLCISRRLPSNRMYSPLADGLQGRRNETCVPPSHGGPIRRTARTNFTYAGPRKLSDILKTELLEDKSSAEIADLWMTYHEGKEKVHGLTLDEKKGKSVLSRAAQCPFFIHPVFREEGHFMIISQFQSPNHFLLAFLEDYRMDPARAQPLLTVSVFDDLAEKDVTLVRCDIINRGIEEDEGYKICKCLLHDYIDEDDFRNVHMFNKQPDAFDVDEFVQEKERRWKESAAGGNVGGDTVDAAGESKNGTSRHDLRDA